MTDRSAEALEFGAFALEFVDRLSSMTSKSEILTATRAALAEFGYERFVMSTMPGPFSKALPRVLLLDLPPGWAEHYLASTYQKIDPVVRFCRSASNPFSWDELTPSPAPRPREVMHRARDFGMNFGLTLPIHGLDGDTSCFSLSARDRPFLNQFTRPAIHLMGIYAFERVRELDSKRAAVPAETLTNREIEVLTWSAAGKSAAKIAEILAITRRTAEMHVTNATRKLGAANKTEAVARALCQRLISL